VTNTALHRYAVLVAVCILIVIASGALVTSLAEGSAGPQQPATQNPVAVQIHIVVAAVVAILVVALAVWQWLAKEGVGPRWFGWFAAAAFGADAWNGWEATPFSHAFLAPVSLAIVVAVAVSTSASWNQSPEPVDAAVAPLLRPFAISAPLLVLLQIVLGAAYRHKLTSVMPHMGGAMIVSLATLVASMLAIQQYPKHQLLRSAAIWLLSIVLTQVTLGVTAFTMQLLELGNSAALVVITASHVVVGSLTLAASLVLAMQVQRNVRPVPAASAAHTD
jgi:heme A synthase